MTKSTHSSDVSIDLLVDGATLRVGQMGRDFLLLDTTIDHPPAEAIIVLRVDQSERRWSVRLPEGISAGRERVKIGLAGRVTE
jgi:hypothetical protein